MGEAGERLIEELRLVLFGGPITRQSTRRQRGQKDTPRVTLVMVHESRVDQGGCDFERFFHVDSRIRTRAAAPWPDTTAWLLTRGFEPCRAGDAGRPDPGRPLQEARCPAAR